MIDEKRLREAKENYDMCLKEGRIRKMLDLQATDAFANNSAMSIALAEKIMNDIELKPYLWTIVCSYYSMFYAANAVLGKLGCKISGKDKHKTTFDALLVLVFPKLRKELLEEYENSMENAIELASLGASKIMEDFGIELGKRGRFQYDMGESAKEHMALASIERAKRFRFEMNRFLTKFPNQ